MEDMIKAFQEYPVGMEIRLKTDYPNTKPQTVTGYSFFSGHSMIILSGGGSVNSLRMEELRVKEERVN